MQLRGNCSSADFRSSTRRTGSISSVMRGHSCRRIARRSPFTSSWSKNCPRHGIGRTRTGHQCISISSTACLPERTPANIPKFTLAQFCSAVSNRSAGNRNLSEPARIGSLRASLISALGVLDDEEIVTGCRERFQKFLADPASIPPDLRPSIFAVVGRYADDAAWKKIHELGLKTTSIEEKQNYYDALACAADPKLVRRTMQIALGDELPTSRAI